MPWVITAIIKYHSYFDQTNKTEIYHATDNQKAIYLSTPINFFLNEFAKFAKFAKFA